MSGLNFYPNETPAIRTLLLHRDKLRGDIKISQFSLISLRSKAADLDESIKSMSTDIDLIEIAVADLRAAKASHDNILHSVLQGAMP